MYRLGGPDETTTLRSMQAINKSITSIRLASVGSRLPMNLICLIDTITETLS